MSLLVEIEDARPLIGEAVAHDIARHARQLHELEPCYWCGTAPELFMAPRHFCGTEGKLSCALCGRDTGQELDGRIIPFMLRAWLREQHPWHEAVTTLLTAADKSLQTINRLHADVQISVRGWTGMPHAVQIRVNRHGQEPQNTSVYDWTFLAALRRALNQSVLAALDYQPLFDLASSGACRNCGANPERHVMRNFSDVLREGDIYCTGCGQYVRTWDPN